MNMFWSVLKILPYLNINEALVQKFPSFRVQLPGNIAVAKMLKVSSVFINVFLLFYLMYEINYFDITLILN